MVARIAIGHVKDAPDAHLATIDRSKIHVSGVDGPIGTTERYGDGDVGRARCVPNKWHEVGAYMQWGIEL